MKKYFTVFLFCISALCFAQSSAVGTLTPEASAIFEVKSVKGGFLAPRMTQAQRDAITAPAAGVMIYNTDVNCYEFWNSSEWFNTCVDGRLDPSSNGTAKISAFDCSGAASGVLNTGIGAVATQQITVTVTRKGSYNISTSAVNGVLFADSGFFDSIGDKVLNLTAYGIPTVAGTYTYTLNTTPSCSFGRTAVNGSLLVISSQPIAPAASCSAKGVVNLSVTASGTTGIGYQWRRNGVALTDDAVISGAASSALKLTGPRTSDSGNYDVVISGDASSSITSAAVQVQINQSPVVVTAEQKICLPATANLTLSGVTLDSTPGLAYSYFTDAAATSALSTPGSVGTGTYYIKGTDSFGCFDIKPVTVSTNSVAVAAIGGGAAVVTVGNKTPAFTDATPGGTWSIANGTGSATIDSSGIVTGVSAGTVTVVYSVTNGGCISAASKSLTIDAGGVIPGNAVCAGKTISKIACTGVSGAVLNDDAATPEGIEYDWASAASSVLGAGFGATTATRALVEIGGQCWARYNMDVVNGNDKPAINDGIDRGSSDYYNSAAGEPAANEGLLYQWSAAMNGSTAERAQGVCPSGWHVPSDCEWMFLENTLGMTVADQVATGYRYSGRVGDLKIGGSSGFSGLFSGYGNSAPAFRDRGSIGYFWSSSVSGSNAFSRILYLSYAYGSRNSTTRAYSFSVRCLKD
ncbi:fibrobacter succinogenes major paralogous domain-containing protein [Flavobacterium humidisoli]|uniref:Fibrobacter succinogenes major paralogous domain-containing protein n=1 Tax=Flavobacterium humidisoli TaxID=2937442 RepID=A0ABY4LYM0_9FLAO|nr:fibrobacter succinogenes major paralogous domain-containing protein [Flavobacterium humidisoli]UPZ17882.1 fibrobacter succinogenes major paralogous domain-containing protein [Flavobacterium humidisoli]